VVVVGGGPSGSTIGSLLAISGHRVLVLERDVHPRDHVGESITPSTNPIFDRMGFTAKIEDAGFVHKPGACWTSPRSSVGRFLSLRLGEFPPPGASRLYTYNVERDDFDTLLLRHAHDQGAKVLQGVRATRVLFDGDRAVGVRTQALDGWEQDVSARFVVDATGRRALIPSQLKTKQMDQEFNQFCIYSWFMGVEPNPPGYEGMLFLHFLDLPTSWAWVIPLRNQVSSVGVVTDKRDFQTSGRTHQEFFTQLIGLNRNLRWAMRSARRIRPWWIEADYSYHADALTGPGWILLGDALRFVDPVFSTGVDVAMYSANYGFEAIDAVLRGQEDEAAALQAYQRRVGDGVQAWFDLISLFYKLRNLFTAYAVRTRFREQVVRILQGNLYIPESLDRARELIALMQESFDKVATDPQNLLAPGALVPPTEPSAPATPDGAGSGTRRSNRSTPAP
jgi:1H-pyrrole-2-carbonyl-[peptidyl-carrier protein] chlorinase